MHLDDKDLGRIRLIPNIRAKRVIVRYRTQEYQVTYPVGISQKELVEVIEVMKPNLLKLKIKVQSEFVFTEETEFTTYSFSVSLKSSPLDNMYISLKNRVLHISYSEKNSLSTPLMQTLIKKAIENACRSEAKRILPSRVKMFADKYGFEVKGVKINNSRGRWGSCSTNKDINLSYFCMMLPERLIDYVILHELCHTKEMNHSKRFWLLVDKVTNGKTAELTKELKSIRLKW